MRSLFQRIINSFGTVCKKLKKRYTKTMIVPTEKTTKKQGKRHVGLELLELMREATRDIPLEEFEKLPKDGAHQHDHYLYGTPKRHD